MDVVWDKGSATVQEVADALPRELGLAYNTVLTTLRILEDKGYLRHKKAKEGRAFIYRPAVSREQASRSAVHTLLRRFFGNSAEALVLNLMDDEKLGPEEVKRIQGLLKGQPEKEEEKR
jgi:BlaI family transcriptional regulator, penicillinase repressor